MLLRCKRLFRTSFIPVLLAPLLAAGACASKKPAGIIANAADSFLAPLDRIVENISDNKEKIRSRKIVVYGFTDMSGRSKPEGRLVAERLTTKLVQTGEFQVIERSRLEAALKELNLNASGIIDEKTAMQAGRMLGAEAAVTGTVARVNGKFEINARTINVETGGILAGTIAYLREEELNVKEDAPVQNYAAPVRAPVPDERAAAFAPVQNRQQTTVEKTVPLKGWEEWPGSGRYNFDGTRIRYMATERQNDYLDEFSNGYQPALLLAKPISGRNWTIDAKVNFYMPRNSGRWFSLYIWFGPPDARPSMNSAKRAFYLSARRHADQADDDIHISAEPGTRDISLDKDFPFIRYQRRGDILKVLVSRDGAAYKEAFAIKCPAAAAASFQRIVLSGQAFNVSGSYADYEYIKFNGKPLF